MLDVAPAAPGAAAAGDDRPPGRLDGSTRLALLPVPARPDCPDCAAPRPPSQRGTPHSIRMKPERTTFSSARTPPHPMRGRRGALALDCASSASAASASGSSAVSVSPSAVAPAASAPAAVDSEIKSRSCSAGGGVDAGATGVAGDAADGASDAGFARVAARVNSASSVRPSAAALEDASSCASSRGCVLREGESWELEPDIAPPSFLREPRANRHPAGF